MASVNAAHDDDDDAAVDSINITPNMNAETSSGANSSMGWHLRIGFAHSVPVSAFGLFHGSGVLWVLVVEQNAVRRAVQIVVLAAVHGPEEDENGDANNQQRRGNHDVKRWHKSSRRPA